MQTLKGTVVDTTVPSWSYHLWNSRHLLATSLLRIGTCPTSCIYVAYRLSIVLLVYFTLKVLSIVIVKLPKWVWVNSSQPGNGKLTSNLWCDCNFSMNPRPSVAAHASKVVLQKLDDPNISRESWDIRSPNGPNRKNYLCKFNFCSQNYVQ